MGQAPEDEVVKKFELELETFGKRNQPKLKLVEDLTLCMRTCKTPEVKKSLSEMTKQAIADLEKDLDTTNKKVQKLLDEAAKKAEKDKKAKEAKEAKAKGKKPVDDKDAQKQTKLKVKVSADKISKKLPKEVFFVVTAKPKSKFPFIDPKSPVVSLGFNF